MMINSLWWKQVVNGAMQEWDFPMIWVIYGSEGDFKQMSIINQVIVNRDKCFIVDLTL